MHQITVPKKNGWYLPKNSHTRIIVNVLETDFILLNFSDKELRD